MYSIQNNPPTQAQIDGRLKKLIFLKYTGGASFFVYSGAIIAIGLLVKDRPCETFWWSLLFFIMAMVGAAMLIYGEEKSKTYKRLTQDKCECILATRHASPAATQYYEAVLAQAREFSFGDLKVLEAEAVRAQEEKDYRALYRHPEPAAG